MGLKYELANILVDLSAAVQSRQKLDSQRQENESVKKVRQRLLAGPPPLAASFFAREKRDYWGRDG